MTLSSAAESPSIQLLAHASLIFGAGGKSVLTDPWTTGTAFADGWAPLVCAELTEPLLADIDYLWISHLHPDHLHPPSLAEVQRYTGRQLTALVPQNGTGDAIEQALGRAGVGRARRLRPGRWVELADGFEVLWASFDRLAARDDQGDSCLFLRCGDQTILNLNDCVVERRWQATELLRYAGLDRVDVLCTQFSYGQWAGNPEDVAARRAKARRKLARVQLQVIGFGARYLVPMASYFRFAHVENSYLNDAVVRPDELARWLRQHTDSAVIPLYAGDRWVLGHAFSATDSSQKWERRYAAAGQDPLTDTKPAGWPEVFDQAANFADRVSTACPGWLRLLLRAIGWLPKLTVGLQEADRRLQLDPVRRRVTEVHGCQPDLEVTADAALRLFSGLHGPEAIRFSGRFRSTGPARFFALATTTASLQQGWRVMLRAEAARLAGRGVGYLRSRTRGAS